MKISRIKGFSDLLPDEAHTWQLIENTAQRIFARYNFGEIRIPVLEKNDLFSRSLGEATDVVEKEMYTFPDADERATLLSLRPEGTAGVVRAYVEGQLFKTEPVRKLYYSGPMFRRERPQKGRLRQFHQIGAEALGRKDPFIDAEILLILRDLFEELGLDGLELELNAIGCADCRPRYRQELLAFLEQRRGELCAHCKRRLVRNPLRVLDCKEPGCRKIVRQAPAISNYRCEACAHHFELLQARLLGAGVAPRLNPFLVRGLDYYCRTTFEWTSSRLGAQNAVAAGGRYDGLVEALGGPSIPGVGFALGVERLVLLLADDGVVAPEARLLYVAWMGDTARREALAAADRMRHAGFRVELDGEEKSLKSQMRRADKLHARWVLLIGERELQQGKVVCRDMENKTQREVSLADLESELREGLSVQGLPQGRGAAWR